LRSPQDAGGRSAVDLNKYIEFAFLGNPPDGIEEDGEFLASVPDVIFENSRFKM